MIMYESHFLALIKSFNIMSNRPSFSIGIYIFLNILNF